MATPRLRVRGNVIQPNPSTLIGEGGEAEIFRIAGDTVLKLYKSPTAVHQAKLEQLPQFPPCVVAPAYLSYDDATGKLIGYTMPFVDNAYHLRSLMNRDFREKSGIDRKQVIDLFRLLHGCLKSIHATSVVVGDFNPLNILIDHQSQPKFIDADSMQWGGFVCNTFTPKYVDPLRCDPSASSLVLTHLHDEKTDWYAFALMLFEALLYVHPYGGVHKLSADQRALKRLSVFDAAVKYPAAAEPLDTLPDTVLDYYKAVLTADRRGEFPTDLFALLQGYRIVTAPRPSVAPDTKGVLICAAVQDGRKVFVYHDNGVFYREDGTPIITGALDPLLHFTMHGRATIVTKGGDSYRIEGKNIERLSIELFRDQTPVVSSNGRQLYWVAAGELWCEDAGHVRHIDSVIAKQTRIWAGPYFGIGLSTARGITRAFLFDGDLGQRLPIELPRLDGLVKEAACLFERDKAQLFLTLEKSKAETTIRLTVNALGLVVAVDLVEDENQA